MAAKKKSLVFTADREKETPGTIRFKSQEEEPEVAYIYIKKGGVKKLGEPAAIKVTIEVA